MLWLLNKRVVSRPMYFVSLGLALLAWQGRHEGILDIFLLSILAVFLAAVAKFVSTQEKRLAQRLRDRKARLLLHQVLSGKRRRYLLYLRPFYITGKMEVANPEHRKREVFEYLQKYQSEGEIADFETILERAVRSEAPLIALGKPGEMIGAGRMMAFEAEWKSSFEKLATQAECILVVPSDRAGTRWEIGRLRDKRYLSKCVFLMPPESTRMDWMDIWSRAAASLNEEGIRVPPYQQSGLLFTLDDHGTVRATRSLDGGRAARRKFIGISAKVGVPINHRVGTVPLLVGLILCVFGIVGWRAMDWETTNARIVSAAIEEGGAFQDRGQLRFIYTFEISGHQYEGTFVEKYPGTSRVTGDMVAVRYESGNPKYSHLAGETVLEGRALFLVIVVILGLICAFIGAKYFRARYERQ